MTGKNDGSPICSAVPRLQSRSYWVDTLFCKTLPASLAGENVALLLKDL